MLRGIGPKKEKFEVEEPEPVETSFPEMTDAEIEAMQPEDVEPVAKVVRSGTLIIIDDPGEEAMKELPEEVFTTVIEPMRKTGDKLEPPFLSDGFMADCYEKTLKMIADKHGKNHRNAITERVMEKYGEQPGNMVFDCLDYGIECGDLIMPRTNYYAKSTPPDPDTDSVKKAPEKKKAKKPRKKKLPEFIGGGVHGLFAVESDYFEVSADDMGAELVAAYSKVRETIAGKPPRQKEVKWADLDELSDSKILIRSVCTLLLEKYDIRSRV